MPVTCCIGLLKIILIKTAVDNFSARFASFGYHGRTSYATEDRTGVNLFCNGHFGTVVCAGKRQCLENYGVGNIRAMTNDRVFQVGTYWNKW